MISGGGGRSPESASNTGDVWSISSNGDGSSTIDGGTQTTCCVGRRIEFSGTPSNCHCAIATVLSQQPSSSQLLVPSWSSHFALNAKTCTDSIIPPQLCITTGTPPTETSRFRQSKRCMRRCVNFMFVFYELWCTKECISFIDYNTELQISV